MAPNVFAVPVFIVVFRETLETAIIVSVLLAFLKQTLGGPSHDPKVHHKLVWQVWLGTVVGLLLCLVIAGAIIGTFYTVGRNAWQAHEYYYEGAFCLLASVIITLMGAGLLRVSHLKDKWQDRLSKALETPVLPKGSRLGPQWFKRLAEKYSMFALPFITVLREGIEAIVFIAGVSFSAPATAIPLPVVVGLIVGGIAGYVIYKTGSSTKLQTFLIVSTCFLYLVAAGLFSRGVWFFETQTWNELLGGDAAELGEGPGSYDIDKSVWHVNCCSPNFNGGGGWSILNAIFGWNNSATYGSVISYNVYWIAIMVGFLVLMFHEKHGHYPFFKSAAPPVTDLHQETINTSPEEKTAATAQPAAEVAGPSAKA